MAVAAYAVHTRSCTYVLDREGICHWVLDPAGAAASGFERCIGAQFVACLDPSGPAQLVGELRLGTTALFACHDGQRFMLLRSPLIEWVEQRAGQPVAAATPPVVGLGRPPEAYGEATERLSVPSDPYVPLPPISTPPPRPDRYSQYRPETAAIARALETDPALDVEGLVTYSEVTLTMPLYRPEIQPEQPPHRHREALSRGERLR